MHAEEWEMTTGREGAWEPEADGREPWEQTHLFRKQFPQPVIFSILLPLLRQREKYDAGRGPSLSLSQPNLLLTASAQNHFSPAMTCDSFGSDHRA